MGAQDLVERADELAALTSALRSAREGRGGVLAIEAAAGHGKTRLLRELRASAETDGFRVLTAVGAPLERDFANGVVRQLLEGEVHSAADERAQRLFAGAAGLAAPVFSVSEGALAAGDVTHARLHGLYWLTANLAEERPLVLIVDDAHWSDAASLRFLDVLSRRVGDLPILVAVGMRPAEPGAESQLLDGLLVAADSTLLRPAALSREGVRALLNAGAEPAFVAACMQSTGGNPLLVTELARSLADAGLTGRADEADAAQRLVPGTVVRSVLARLRGLGPEAVDFARSLAVLGDRSSIERVGRLAGLARGDAGAAHPVLVRAGLIAGEELRFVHPMVRDAVAADLIGDERGRLHAQAARVLADDGVSDTEVAIHLMHAPAQAAGWAARSLLASARQALDAGAPEVAVRQLTRAVAEPPDAADVPDVLLALGLAQTRAGDSAAAATLESAAAAGDSAVAAAAALVRANLLVLRGRPDDALGALLPPPR